MPDRLLRKCTAPACLEARDEVVPIYFGEDPYKGVSTAPSTEPRPDQAPRQQATVFSLRPSATNVVSGSGPVRRGQ